MEFTVKKVAENIWAIEQPAVRSFLLLGPEDALGGTAVPVGPAPAWFPDTVKTYRHGWAQMFW